VETTDHPSDEHNLSGSTQPFLGTTKRDATLASGLTIDALDRMHEKPATDTGIPTSKQHIFFSDRFPCEMARCSYRNRRKPKFQTPPTRDLLQLRSKLKCCRPVKNNAYDEWPREKKRKAVASDVSPLPPRQIRTCSEPIHLPTI